MERIADNHQPRSVLAAFSRLCHADPDTAAVLYYGNRISRAELDSLSDRLAVWLAEEGIGPGERVAVSLENTPMFAVALLATWKLGGVLIPVSPVLGAGELITVLADSQARVMLAHPEMADVVIEASRRVMNPPTLGWSRPFDLAGQIAPSWSSGDVVPTEGTFALAELERRSARAIARHEPAPDDLALLVYTAGTTGPSKAAMLSHANVAVQAATTPKWLGLSASDSVISIAPFSHISGLGLQLALGLGGGFPLVMTYRFDAGRVVELIERYAPTFTVASITSFAALADEASSEESRAALRRLTSAVSCGGAVSPTGVERYEREFGVYLRSAYGLTETASACISVPADLRAPSDPMTGAVSVGRPLPGVTVTIVADDGGEAPLGTPGEIVIQGPQVGLGYWNRPDETVSCFQPDGLHTGDIGFVDEQGWIYLLDRKKDLITVSGYQVWPRDVEDVLYRHSSVAEVAVVGVPDDFGGESVKAFVVPKPNLDLTAYELNRHCREHLSAYKCPRAFEIVATLPKSPSGRILRRLLKPSSWDPGAGISQPRKRQ